MRDVFLDVVDRNTVLKCELIDINLSSVRWELNGPGEVSFEIHPKDPKALHLLLWDHEIRVWIDDEMMWQGPLWNCEGDSQMLTFTAEGLESLFQKRFVDDGTLEYGTTETPMEQLLIAQNLVEFAQTGDNRDFNIGSAPFAASGVERLRIYERNEHQNIYDLLSEFTELSDGFDWAVIADGSGQRLWTPYYPRRGSVKATYAVEWDRNLGEFQYSESAIEMATQVYVTGGTNGEVKFEQNYEDLVASAQHGVMQEIVSEGQQKDTAWLLERAIKETNRRKNPVVKPTPTVVPVPVDLLGKIEPGDYIPLNIDYGRIQTSGLHRILAITWTPDDKLELEVDKTA